MEMRFTDRAHPELPGFGQFSAGCFARHQVVGFLPDVCAYLVSGFSEQQFGSASAHGVKRRRCLRCVEQRQAEGPALFFESALGTTPQASHKAIVIPLNLAILPSLVSRQINLLG